MVLKLVRTDQDSASVNLAIGIHEFGRGVFLHCGDKRVSRCHGKLEVDADEKIILTSLHKNPCFVIIKDTPGIIVMSKGMTRELSVGDEFGLLPEEYWYKITTNGENDQERMNDKAVQNKGDVMEETNADVEKPKSPSDEKKIHINIQNLPINLEPHSSRDVTQLNFKIDSTSEKLKKRLPSPDLACEDSSSSAKLQRLSSESLHIDVETPLQKIKRGAQRKFESAYYMHSDGEADTAEPLVPMSRSPVLSEESGILDTTAIVNVVGETFGAKRGQGDSQTEGRRRGPKRGPTPTKCRASSSRARCGAKRGAGTDEAHQVKLPSDDVCRQLLLGASLSERKPLNMEDFCWDAAYFGRAAPGGATTSVVQRAPQQAGGATVAAPSEAPVAAEEPDSAHLDFGLLDEGSEYSDTDDEEWLPQSTGNNAARDDLENAPEVSAMVSAIQDAGDDVMLSTGSIQGIFSWSPDYSTFTGSREVFTGTPGPTTPCDTPYENFCQIWDQEIMNTIAKETNRYAWQTIIELTESGQLTEKSRIHDWYDTTIDELYVLFAIFMYMAIDQRSRLDEYWATDSVLEMPRFQRLMTFRRYQLLTKFLHFADNYSLPQRGNDRKVAKLQPIIDHCNRKFQSCYVPHQYIAVDESLTLWKGHLTWIQNMISKSARFSIKTYELCESTTGYLWKFYVYTGKTCNVSSNSTELNSDLLGKTSAIVLNMVQDLHHKGYCLTMDNFYNSPALARKLKTLGIDCIGTLRSSRKNVPEAIKKLKKKTMDPGAVVSRHCGDVSVQSWNDGKIVTTISTYHAASMYLGRHGNRTQMKPIVIKDYNMAIGGVDLKDQKLSMYLLERKRTHKWYIKMFKRLLNTSILNSSVMHHYTKVSKREKPFLHRQFRHELANALVEKHLKVSSVPVASISTDADRLDGSGHYLYPNVRTCEKCKSLDNPSRDTCKKCNTVGARRCARCSALGKRVMTKFHCKKCDKGLCPGLCCEEYHTVKDLKV